VPLFLLGLRPCKSPLPTKSDVVSGFLDPPLVSSPIGCLNKAYFFDFSPPFLACGAKLGQSVYVVLFFVVFHAPFPRLSMFSTLCPILYSLAIPTPSPMFQLLLTFWPPPFQFIHILGFSSFSPLRQFFPSSQLCQFFIPCLSVFISLGSSYSALSCRCFVWSLEIDDTPFLIAGSLHGGRPPLLTDLFVSVSFFFRESASVNVFGSFCSLANRCLLFLLQVSLRSMSLCFSCFFFCVLPG